MQVICQQIEEEESMPEDQRPTALARSYYLKVSIYFTTVHRLHGSMAERQGQMRLEIASLFGLIFFKSYAF